MRMMKRESLKAKRRKCQTTLKARLRRPRRTPRSEPPAAPAPPARAPRSLTRRLRARNKSQTDQFHLRLTTPSITKL